MSIANISDKSATSRKSFSKLFTLFPFACLPQPFHNVVRELLVHFSRAQQVFQVIITFDATAIRSEQVFVRRVNDSRSATEVFAELQVSAAIKAI